MILMQTYTRIKSTFALYQLLEAVATRISPKSQWHRGLMILAWSDLDCAMRCSYLLRFMKDGDGRPALNETEDVGAFEGGHYRETENTIKYLYDRVRIQYSRHRHVRP